VLSFWHKFKAFFGHHLILELAILGPFIAFAINPGSLGDLMRVCGAIFLFNVLIGNYRIGDVTEGHLVVLCIFLVILLMSAIMPDEMIHRRSFRYFLTFPGMILAIHCLSKRMNPGSRILLFYSSIAILSLIIQFITYHTIERVINSGGNESYGIYSNMHHFGSFASLILPVLFYFATQIKGWLRLLSIAGVIVAFYLMLESSSRISWLSFYIALLLAIFLFAKKIQMLIGIGSILAASLIGAYVSGLAAIKNRIVDIFSNWRTEERITIWTDTLNMLGDSSVKDWLLGHGIGSFRYYFPEYNTFKVSGKVVNWNFPHNVFLQIIFENGVLGLAIILAGIVLLLLGLWRGYRLLQNRNDRYLLVTIFILFTINFIHCTFTLSFYDKYFIYPFSATCGVALVLLEKTGQSKPLKSLSWFQSLTNFLINKMPGFSRWLTKRKIDI
jgi:O-antigen ligase